MERNYRAVMARRVRQIAGIIGLVLLVVVSRNERTVQGAGDAGAHGSPINGAIRERAVARTVALLLTVVAALLLWLASTSWSRGSYGEPTPPGVGNICVMTDRQDVEVALWRPTDMTTWIRRHHEAPSP